MQSATTQPTKGKKTFVAIMVLIFGSFTMALAFPAVSRAETQTSNGTKLYCLSKLPQKAKAACQNDALINKMRNAASYHCKSVTLKKNRKETCITNKTKDYINEANKNLTGASHFEGRIKSIIQKDTDKTGGDINKPSPDAQEGLDEETNIFGSVTAEYVCGGGENEIKTSVDFGCKGKGNAMLDLAFAIIRFLSNGAGLVIIGSLVWAGIQYSGSRGDPQSSALAINRIQSTVFALFIFIFAYAIINFLVPGVFLR